MKCDSCHHSIASGVDAKKMICAYTQPDGATRIFGYLMPDGPLTEATGRLAKGWHHKCYHQLRKREARGNAVTGRVIPGMPTAYEANLGTALDGLRDAVAEIKALAREVGKPVGDPHVHEAYQAKQHGGPYPHTHTMPLDAYQLLGHLHYAHGKPRAPQGHDKRPLAEQHAELHAQAAQQGASAARIHDPGHDEPVDQDWREQRVAEL